MHTLESLRQDFELRTNRSLSMPMAGAVIWALVAVIGWIAPPRLAVLALAACTGAIFPLALLIARIRREEILSNTNALARLMGACVFMVNLLWAVHLPLMARAPTVAPLSVGVGLGLHWVVYSWIVQHPVGYIHAALRTALVVTAWSLFREHAVTACAIAVVVSYGVSIYLMSTRRIASAPVRTGT